jgi:hypothetical protein
MSEKKEDFPHSKISSESINDCHRNSSKNQTESNTLLIEQGIDEWSVCTDDIREQYLNEIEGAYKVILGEFHEHSNICVDKFEKLGKSYKKWRVSLILLTGILAVFNVVIAYSTSPGEKSALIKVFANYLPIFAAVYAAGLAVFTNIESFFKYQEKAQAFRDARDIFLDNFREYRMLWFINVHAFGTDAAACVNATQLYNRIVAKDKEVRSYARDLTQEIKEDS